MQLTSIVSLALAAAAVNAAPGSLSARQQGAVTVNLHQNDGGCTMQPVGQFALDQGERGTACFNTSIEAPHNAISFVSSTTTCTFKVYNQRGCNEGGGHLEVGPRFVGCRAINFQSGKFICNAE